MSAPEMVTGSLESLIIENREIFNQELEKVITPSFTGLKNPEKYKGIVENFINSSQRVPFARQARLIAAATEYLKNNRSLIVSAEMGTGKTQMGIAISQDKQYKVNFITCPPHLVEKWEEEILTVYTADELLDIEIVHVERWRDLLPYTKRNLRKTRKKYYFIISREMLKLSYPKTSAFKVKKKRVIKEVETSNGKTEKSFFVKNAVCPDCDHLLLEANDYGKIDSDSIPRKCPNCETVLRDTDKSASDNMQERISIAEFIRRNWKKNSIDLLLADELHEYKGGNTGQGQSLAQMAAMSKKIVGLTGTLLNGYASSVFYILYRLNPSMIKNELGFEYKDVKEFVKKYGSYEEKYQALEVDKEGKVTKFGRKIGQPKERPKISPYLLSVLLSMTIFLRLDEIKMEDGQGLPDYDEFVRLVDMDEELLQPYMKYIKEITDKLKDNPKLLGNLASDSIAVADLPFQEHSAQNEVFYNPPYTREEYGLTNKEKELINALRDELNQGRQCLVYAHFTGKGIGDDLLKILQNHLPDKKIKFLKTNVPPKKRKAWIENNPCDVLICNPELVKTGLDLLEFPTLIFYETSYNVCATC